MQKDLRETLSPVQGLRSYTKKYKGALYQAPEGDYTGTSSIAVVKPVETTWQKAWGSAHERVRHAPCERERLAPCAMRVHGPSVQRQGAHALRHVSVCVWHTRLLLRLHAPCSHRPPAAAGPTQVVHIPFLAKLMGFKVQDTSAYKKGEEFVADLKEKYETSDHPMVHKVRVAVIFWPVKRQAGDRGGRAAALRGRRRRRGAWARTYLRVPVCPGLLCDLVCERARSLHRLRTSRSACCLAARRARRCTRSARATPPST